jgi:hypothetical protein
MTIVAIGDGATPCLEEFTGIVGARGLWRATTITRFSGLISKASLFPPLSPLTIAQEGNFADYFRLVAIAIVASRDFLGR